MTFYFCFVLYWNYLLLNFLLGLLLLWVNYKRDLRLFIFQYYNTLISTFLLMKIIFIWKLLIDIRWLCSIRLGIFINCLHQLIKTVFILQLLIERCIVLFIWIMIWIITILKFFILISDFKNILRILLVDICYVKKLFIFLIHFNLFLIDFET